MKKRSNDDWFRPRSYLHFDSRLGFSSRLRVENFIKNPSNIARHNFYPFISYDRTKYKIVEDEALGTRHLNDKGVRTLSYAAHMDSHIYAYYSDQLSKLYEAELIRLGLCNSVIAFRKLKDLDTNQAKSNIHFAHDAFRAIAKMGNSVVYTFDITGFFDNLRADILKRNWARTLKSDQLPLDHFKVFSSITAHSVVDRDELYKALGLSKNPVKDLKQLCEGSIFRSVVRSENTTIDTKTGHPRRGLIVTKQRGIPQGSPISGLLANMYMLDFDFEMNQKMKVTGGEYFRYCDDLFFILSSENDFDLEEMVKNKLHTLGLTINTKKSERSCFSVQGSALKCDRPIQYLGFVFDGERKYIRAASISRHLRKLKESVRRAKLTQNKYNNIRAKKGLPPETLYRKEIFERFSHTGDSNFITYGLRAAEVMQSQTIRSQMKKMGKLLERELQSVQHEVSNI